MNERAPKDGEASPDASESLRHLVGAWSTDRLTTDEVNLPMIRHWCEAMSDWNPLYTDREAAAASSHGGLVAPPAMLDTWMMPGHNPLQTQVDAEGRPVGLVPVIEALDEAGFTSIVATNTTHEYDRYLRPGDRVSARAAVTKLSSQKETALGPGHFLTAETEFHDQNGERVGRMIFRLLKFKPSGDLSADALGGGATMERPRPAISRDTKFFWDGVDAGELRIQKCTSCGHLYHPPVVRCRKCGSYELGYTVASGRGTVYSFAEVQHPQFPMFQYPLVGVLVELEEGTRFLSNLVAADPEHVEIGLPVELAITEVDPNLKLPLFRPARPPRRETTRTLDEVAVGDRLPMCPVPITATQIVAGALASRDFQEVHHDPEIAKLRGLPNIFMNIMTSGGLTARYVTDWAGPEARLRRMGIRLGIPNFPGDTMTYVGEVKSKEVRDEVGVVELEVRGFNSIGDHVTGDFALELPTGKGAGA